jgi:hypothetical protein
MSNPAIPQPRTETVSSADHLDRSIDLAIAWLPASTRRAHDAFMQAVKLHEGTAGIASHPVYRESLHGAIGQGVDRFRTALMFIKSSELIRAHRQSAST